MYDEIKEIPKELLQRDKVMEALIYISEQNITKSMKVLLLIGYGRKINSMFSLQQIDLALRDHSDTDVETE